MHGGRGENDAGAEAASAFQALFRDTYLRFHRRDGRRSELSGASRAVLLHLAMTGPLTIGEAARHLDRAQSGVSEIVSQLERHGLLERHNDPADRRRVLIWLAPAGVDRLRRDAQVLSTELLEDALEAMRPDDVSALLHGLRTLLGAGELLEHGHHTEERPTQEDEHEQQSDTL